MEDRRLAAIMFTDIVGYTELMGRDENQAFQLLRKNRKIQKPLIEKYRGEWLKEMGDGILASFSSASDAVRCASEIQDACKKEEVALRIGIHEGEVVFEGGDVLGDGVNVASRLEELAEEGAINISGAVFKDIKNKAGIVTEFIEEKKLKGVDDPVKVYRILGEGEELKPKKVEPKKDNKKYQNYKLGGVVIVVAAFLIWNYLPEKSTVELDKSIAVLPFKYLSEDQNKQYLADGVMDVITSHLAKISSLKVKARTSVEKYRDNEKDVREIGSELNVNYIVEGSFFLHENMARLTIQLINTRNGNHVFTKEYEREWSDIFKVQSEVSQTIAREINAIINPREKQIIETIPTHNLTAYDFYLQAEEEFNTYVKTGDTTYLNKALPLYQKALENDSTFADAYLGLASVYINKLPYYDIYFKNVGIDSCRTLIDIALSYNDQLEKAYLFLGAIYSNFLGDPDQGLIYFDKAIAINPNYADGYNSRAYLYLMKDDVANAIPNYYKSLELNDAFWKPWNLGRLSWCYFVAGFYEKSIFYAREKLKLDADSIDYYDLLAGINFSEGNLAKSLDLYAKVYSMDSTSAWALNMMIQILTLTRKHSEALHHAIILDSLIVKENLLALNYAHRVAYALWINGEKERARYYFDKQLFNCQESIEMKRPYAIRKWAHYDLAAVYAFYDDKVTAFRYLNEYGTKRFEQSNMIQWLETDPLFNNIRKDERFQKIYIDMKSKYQKEHERVRIWLEEQEML